jgi:hypothetical protein
VGSIMVVVAPLIGSSAMMFAAMENLSSACGTVAIASEIGGVVFAPTSVFDSSIVT